MLSQVEYERIFGYQKPGGGGDGDGQSLQILPEYPTMGNGADMGSVDAEDPGTDFTAQCYK